MERAAEKSGHTCHECGFGTSALDARTNGLEPAVRMEQGSGEEGVATDIA